MAHRLALAASQAASDVTTITKYRKTLSAIYSHFSHSTVYTHEVQKILEEPEIKMKKLYDIRWLRFHNVVVTIRRSLTSLIVYFENAAEKEGDATAIGIHRAITTYSFLILTHFFGCAIYIIKAQPHLSASKH